MTDGTGQFRIEQLRGGTYTVVFTLPGFAPFVREGIELTGSFAATINAELKLGSVEETITVTGDTPIVDIQSAQRQRVIDQELLDAIPTGRTPQVAAFMIPGVNLSNVDVGGTNIINTTGGSLSIHGGRVDDTRLLIDGITIANTEGTGWSANMLPNMGSTQEVSVDYSSVTAESITGGLQINMIPKTGGNSYSGTLFATAVNSAFEGSNNDDDLVARGLRTPNITEAAVRHQPRTRRADCEQTSSGSIRRGASRGQANYIGGLFQNLNANDITQWTVRAGHRQAAPSRMRPNRASTCDSRGRPTRPTRSVSSTTSTGAVSAARRLPLVAQEAANELEYPISDLTSVSWTATPSNKLLVEARFGVAPRRVRLHAQQPSGPAATADPCHRAGRSHPGSAVSRQRAAERDAALSAHARRQHAARRRHCRMSPEAIRPRSVSTTSRRSATSDVPDNVVAPDVPVQQRRAESAHAARDAAVSSRAAEARPRPLRPGQVDAQAPDAERRPALRHFQSYFPEQTLGPGPLVPNRNLTFPKTDMANWKDIVPRLGRLVRPVRQRQDRTQGVAQQVRHRARAAGHVRRHGQPGEPPRQHRDPLVERREPRTSFPTAI